MITGTLNDRERREKNKGEPEAIKGNEGGRSRTNDESFSKDHL